MLKAPEPRGVARGRRAVGPGGSRTRVGEGRGREGSQGSGLSVTRGRRVGCAAPLYPKNAGPGSRRPLLTGDHAPQGPGEVGTLVLTLHVATAGI